MKKVFIIGFILLSITAQGEMGIDIKQNQIILDNIKLENTQLKNEAERLTLVLDRLEENLVKEEKFEGLGVEIRRDEESFALSIESEDLSQGEYKEILDNFIETIKYDSKDSIILKGTKINIEFLNSYFTTMGIDPVRITSEIEEKNDVVSDKTDSKGVKTKIILKKKEN
ncbi:MAG: hypothetical protein WBG30_15300 [Psychrilyobacter sp.]|uniref:hypothetical protein n=1 Tax=Psychrilyobacter sp. TaxID=2586924 RepID=UPI003C75E7A0